MPAHVSVQADQMRILVTGRDGQVARSLSERAPGDVELIFASRPDLDLADLTTVATAVARVKPDLVISAAAYTAVDMAEDEPDLAMRINGEAPGVLARACREIGAPIVHLSTDYVFDGKLERPYKEDDPVSPIGAYSRSKLAGEQAVRASGANHVILRTAWVYSPFGNNFVKTMLRLAGERDALTVVGDQIGCPTSAHDIADAVLMAAKAWRAGEAGFNETYHFAGSGETSWAGLAREVLQVSRSNGGPWADVTDIATADWPTKAARPSNSRLDCTKFQQAFGHAPPHWRASVEQVVVRLLDESNGS